jgi:hypothetical protein
VLLLDLRDVVGVVAHPPEGFEDGFVLAGQPFGSVRAVVVDDAEPDVLDAFQAGHVVFTNVLQRRLDAVAFW